MRRSERNVYLQMKTLNEAQAMWTETTQALRTAVERIPSHEALHRVMAQPISALRIPFLTITEPPWTVSPSRPRTPSGRVKPSRCAWCWGQRSTSIPEILSRNTDAVIMIENVEPVGEREVEIRHGPFPGSTCVKSEKILLPVNCCCRSNTACDRQTLAHCWRGGSSVTVYTRPRVWIQPTGTELIPPEASGRSGAGTDPRIQRVGPRRHGTRIRGERLLQDIIVDDYDSIKRALVTAVASSADVVLINAGSSAGSEDYTSSIIGELGRFWSME